MVPVESQICDRFYYVRSQSELKNKFHDMFGPYQFILFCSLIFRAEETTKVGESRERRYELWKFIIRGTRGVAVSSGANVTVLYSSFWPLSRKPAEQEAKPKDRYETSYLFLAIGFVVLVSKLKRLVWRAQRDGHDPLLLDVSDVQRSDTFKTSTYIGSEARWKLVQAFDVIGEEHYETEPGYSEEVYKNRGSW